MSRLVGAAGVLVVLVVAMVFAALNGGNRVVIDLGWLVLYRVPVTFVAFGGLFFGMLVMLLAGLHTDLRVRAILRQRLADEDREEKTRVDTQQQDLFATEHMAAIAESAPGDGSAGTSSAHRSGTDPTGASEAVILPLAGTVTDPEAVVTPLAPGMPSRSATGAPYGDDEEEARPNATAPPDDGPTEGVGGPRMDHEGVDDRERTYDSESTADPEPLASESTADPEPLASDAPTLTRSQEDTV